MNFNGLLDHEVLSSAEHIQLLKRIKAGNREALNELVRVNQRFVASICLRYWRNNTPDVEFHDVLQAGNLGLLKAIDMWEESRNTVFSTYAFYWIRSYARRYALHCTSDFSLSFRSSERILDVRRSRTRLLVSFHREPTVREIAADTGFSIKEVRELLRSMSRSIRIEDRKAGSDDEDEEALYRMRDILQDTEEDGLQGALLAMVKRSISRLPERQRLVMNHLYGLDGCKLLTPRELSEQLNITRQGVDEITKNAIKRIKKDCGAWIQWV